MILYNAKLFVLQKRYATYLSAFFVIVLSGLNTIFQFLNFTLLSKYLTVEAFGSYRVFLSLVSFSGLFHAGYIDGLVSRWIIENDKPFINSFIMMMGISCVLSLSLFFYPYNETHFILLFAFFIISNIVNFASGVFLKQRLYTFPSLYLLFSQFMLMAYCIYAKNDLTVTGLVSFSLVVSLAFLIVIGFISVRLSFINFMPTGSFFDLPEIKKDLRTGIPILLLGIFFLSLFHLDKIILPLYYSKTQFGYYAFASSLVTVVLGVMLSPVNLIFSKMVGMSDEKLVKLYNNAYIVLFIAGIALLAAVPVIELLIERYIPKYIPATSFIYGFAFMVFPVLVLQLLVANLYRRNKLTHVFLRNSIYFLGLIVAFYFTAVQLGVTLAKMPFGIAQILLLFLLMNDLTSKNRIPLIRSGIGIRVTTVLIFNAGMVVFYLL